MTRFRVVPGKHKPWEGSEFKGVVSAVVDGSPHDVSSGQWPIPFDFIVPELEFEATLRASDHPVYGRQYSARGDVSIMDSRYALSLSAMRQKLTPALLLRLKGLARRFGRDVFLKLAEVESNALQASQLAGGSPRVSVDHVLELVRIFGETAGAVNFTESFPPMDTNTALKYVGLIEVSDVRADPYILFWRKPEGRLHFNPLHVADAVARSHLEMPVRPDDSRRLRAYFEAALKQLQRDRMEGTSGSTWFERGAIKKAMTELQSGSDGDWAFDASILDRMFEDAPDFVSERGGLFARSSDDLVERSLARRLVSIQRRGAWDAAGVKCLSLLSRLQRGDGAAEVELDAVCADWRPVYSHYAKCDELQRSTLRVLMERRVLVLMGGAGTGKSTTLALVVLFMNTVLGVPMQVCALTGKAVDRMKQLFDGQIDCRTLHSQAALSEQSPAEALAIDEASMAFPSILNKIVTQSMSYLVICGDDKQLPSIDPGAFLRDVVAADVFPVVRLERVYRSGEGSGIATEAPKIFGTGETQLAARSFEKRGFKIVLDCDLDAAVREFGRLAQQSKHEHVIMISNTRRTCRDANRDLQPICNPAAADRSGSKLARPGGAAPWVVGDRVISNENIDLEGGRRIFNGMIGHVKALNLGERKVAVQFRDLIHEFGAGDNAIEHAYCVTTWKFQGSEIAHAIVLFDSAWGLSCELLYTAVTRGQLSTTAFLSQQHLKIALATRVGPKRVTRLAEQIKTAHRKREHEDE